LLAIGLTPLFLAGAARAQENSQPAEKVSGQGQAIELPESWGGMDAVGGLGGEESRKLVLSAQLTAEQGSRKGILEVKAVLAPHWHTYAVDQQGGPGPSKITVKSADKAEVLSAFRPDREPKVRSVEFFDDPLREHYEQVTWSAPVRLADGVDPEAAQLEVQFDGQICNDDVGCKPIFGKTIQVAFGGYYEPAKPAGEYRSNRSHATLQGHVEPSVISPGSTVRLVVTAVSDPDWHIYAHAPEDPDEISKPTLIAVAEPASWSVGSTIASSEPTVKALIPGDAPVRYHDGSITWTTEIAVPQDVEAGEYELSGIIGYQTCTDRSCDPPAAAKFAVTVTVGDGTSDKQRPLTFEPSRYAEVARLTADGTTPKPDVAAAPLDLDNIELADSGQDEPPLALVLVFAFVGGFILNFMPCVLPVIGLKIMSFVQQAGESRARVFALNVWYSLGLVSVFMVLATLGAVWSFGWGEQFKFDAFNITMAAVVFTMGLSFLGVWEIPIPGFVGSGKASELAEKEGPAGAFSKGIITTILATPCSGPGLATALGYCNGKPAALVYMVFAAMGLGMASPYLVIGANPRLARFIPKPGAWMETFKETMGFVLLGTVIFILTFIDWVNVLPTLALLIGLWGGCWWIGRTPITVGFQAKFRAWAGAAVFATLVGLFAFAEGVDMGGYRIYGLRGIMQHRLTVYVDKKVQTRITGQDAPANSVVSTDQKSHDSELAWEPFSQEKLARLTAERRTVLVDFTADWCLTCKTLETTVLNTQEVRRVVEANKVVTLVADWTDGNPEISKMLEALGSKQVPVIAIFPAGRPNQPLVLRGFYTKKTLIDKLEEAGPSRDMARREAGPVERMANSN
jgi:thiol:disulfide interchange protein